MARWEYLVRVRHRDQGLLKSRKWQDDIVGELPRLGDDGWELVAISPQAGAMGSQGVTTEEVWVFKRPK